jgi:transposase
VTRSSLSPDDVAAVAAAFDQGFTRTELASTYGVHPNTISRLLRQSGTNHRVARKRVLDTDQERRVVEAYVAGESTRAIGARFGVTAQHVSRVAIRQGAAPRRPGLPGRRRRVDDHASGVLASEYRNGATIHALAADHAVSYSAVYRALERSNVPRRPPHITRRHSTG